MLDGDLFLRIPVVYCASNRVKSKEALSFSVLCLFGVQNLNLFSLHLILKFQEFMDKLDWAQLGHLITLL